MFLKWIKLTNLRNYSKLDFKFKTPTTVLVGDNAQGKTNFLESIYFLATSKSQKAEKDQELIKEGEEFTRVDGLLDNKTFLEIVIQLQNNHLIKKVKINGVPKKVSDYSQNLAVVLFSPEDINLVSGAPSLRRYHIDQTLSQIDREYKRALTSYENVVIRKNRVLKAIQEGHAKIDQLIYWSDQQVLLGTLLSEKKKQYFEFLNNAEKKFGEFSFEYIQSKISTERLKEYQAREIASANSLVGPHRDDFLFLLNGKDLAKFGSRGEQRTAVLDLKISEATFIEEVLGERPILLLDDIFSELDLSHRQHVLDLSKLQQTIITAIELENPIKSQLKDAIILYVENGRIN